MMLIHIILVIITIAVNGVFIKPEDSAKVIAVEDRHKSKLDKHILKTGEEQRYGVVLIDKKKCSDLKVDCYTKGCRYKCNFNKKPVKDGNITLESSIYYVNAPFKGRETDPMLLCADWSLTHSRRFVRVFSDKQVIHNTNQVHAECHWNATILGTGLDTELLHGTEVLHYRGIRNTEWKITNHDTTKIPRIKSGILMMNKNDYSTKAAKYIMAKIIAKQLGKTSLIAISGIATAYGVAVTPLLATIFVVRTIKEGVQTQGVTALKPEQAQTKVTEHVDISKTDIILDKSTGYLAENEVACINIITNKKKQEATKCVGIHDRSKNLKERYLRQKAYAILVADPGDCRNPSKSKIYCEFTYEAIARSGTTAQKEATQDLSVRLFVEVPGTKRSAYLCTAPVSNGVRYVELRDKEDLDTEGRNCEWSMVKSEGGDSSAFVVWKEEGDTDNRYTISSHDAQYQVGKPRILMQKNGKIATTELAKKYAKTIGVNAAAVTIIGGIGVGASLAVGVIPIFVGIGAGAINALSRPVDTAITHKDRSDARFSGRRLATEDQDKPNVSSYFNRGIIGTAIITFIVLVGSFFIYVGYFHIFTSSSS